MLSAESEKGKARVVSVMGPYDLEMITGLDGEVSPIEESEMGRAASLMPTKQITRSDSAESMAAVAMTGKFLTAYSASGGVTPMLAAAGQTTQATPVDNSGAAARLFADARARLAQNNVPTALDNRDPDTASPGRVPRIAPFLPATTRTNEPASPGPSAPNLIVSGDDESIWNETAVGDRRDHQIRSPDTSASSIEHGVEYQDQSQIEATLTTDEEADFDVHKEHVSRGIDVKAQASTGSSESTIRNTGRNSATATSEQSPMQNLNVRNNTLHSQNTVERTEHSRNDCEAKQSTVEHAVDVPLRTANSQQHNVQALLKHNHDEFRNVSNSTAKSISSPLDVETTSNTSSQGFATVQQIGTDDSAVQVGVSTSPPTEHDYHDPQSRGNLPPQQLPTNQLVAPQEAGNQSFSRAGFDERQYHPSPPGLVRPMSFVPLPRDQSGNLQETIHVNRPPTGLQESVNARSTQSSRTENIQLKARPTTQQQTPRGPSSPPALYTVVQQESHKREQSSSLGLNQPQSNQNQANQRRLYQSSKNLTSATRSHSPNHQLSAYHATSQQHAKKQALPKQSRLASLFGKKSSVAKPQKVSMPPPLLNHVLQQSQLRRQQIPVAQPVPQISQLFTQHSAPNTSDSTAVPLRSISPDMVSVSEISRNPSSRIGQSLSQTTSVSSASESLRESLRGQASISPSQQLYRQRPNAPAGEAQTQAEHGQVLQFQRQTPHTQQERYGKHGDTEEQVEPMQQAQPLQPVHQSQPSRQGAPRENKNDIQQTSMPHSHQHVEQGQSTTPHPIEGMVTSSTQGTEPMATSVTPVPETKKKLFSAIGTLFGRSGTPRPRFTKKNHKGQLKGTQHENPVLGSVQPTQVRAEHQQRPWNLHIPAAGDQERDREVMGQEIWYAAERRWAQPSPGIGSDVAAINIQSDIPQQHFVRSILPGHMSQAIPAGAQQGSDLQAPNGQAQGQYFVHPSNPNHVVYLFPTAPGEQPQGIIYASRPNEATNLYQPPHSPSHMPRPSVESASTDDQPLAQTGFAPQQQLQPLENLGQSLGQTRLPPQAQRQHVDQIPPRLQDPHSQQHQALRHFRQQTPGKSSQESLASRQNKGPSLPAPPAAIESTNTKSASQSVSAIATSTSNPELLRVGNKPLPDLATTLDTQVKQNEEPQDPGEIVRKLSFETIPRPALPLPIITAPLTSEIRPRRSSIGQNQQPLSQFPPHNDVKRDVNDSSDARRLRSSVGPSHKAHTQLFAQTQPHRDGVSGSNLRPRSSSETIPPSQQGSRGRPQSMISTQPKAAGLSPGRFYSRQSLEQRRQSLERPVQPIPEAAKPYLAAQQMGFSASGSTDSLNTKEVPPISRRTIPLLQPKPKQFNGSVRYAPPAIGLRGVVLNERPASYAGSASAKPFVQKNLSEQPGDALHETSSQNTTASPSKTKINEQPIIQSYHPPPLALLTRVRPAESASKAGLQRALSTVSEAHSPPHSASINLSATSPPPPPPKDLPSSLGTTDVAGKGTSGRVSLAKHPLSQGTQSIASTTLADQQETKDVKQARHNSPRANVKSSATAQISDNVEKTFSGRSNSPESSQASASGVPYPTINFPTRKPSTTGGQSEVYELPTTSGHDDDDEPVMMAVSYPGDEWIPEWNGLD